MTLMAWLLTTEGVATRLETVTGVREAVQSAVGSDLITAIPIAVGVYIWTDMLSILHDRKMNAAAMGFADRMQDRVTQCDIPRIHGNIVIAAADGGEPAEIDQETITALRQRFAA